VRVETLRDATGRVLRRERIDGTGRYTLLDDTQTFAPVQVSRLPAPPATPAVRLRPGTDPAFGAELVRATSVPLDRTFSLAQIRNITEVRALAPVMSSDPVLFQTGSAALSPEQAATLSGIAGVMLELLRTNPREVFLVEGHTDATGSAAFNLALSDRRAETVAQALVDYFGVPPENLVFQGYGEALLTVPTQAAEERNRRVEIRRVTTLLHPWET
jgi:outer membrane protein OmpA-like peptidoglycan-associated protein